MFAIVTGLLSLGKTLVNGWSERKTLEVQAKNTRLQKVIDGEMQWDQLMAEGSQTSWKDEFWTIVLAFPLIIMFTAALFNQLEIIERLEFAFDTMKDLPSWYLSAVGVAIAAAFGWRKIAGKIGAPR